MSATLNRVDIVQQAIDYCKARNYLEIGVKKGKLFLDVRARKKLAIDPVLKISAKRKWKHCLRNIFNIFNEYYEMTSDHYFATQTSRLTRLKKVDVAFIDGQHTYQQSLTDVNNCLKYLSKKGVVLMHDCSPQSDVQACPAQSREHADRISPDGKTTEWSGDVWKTIVNLRSSRPDLDVFVLNCDHGIGVITHGSPEKMLELSEEKIEAMSYRHLAENREEFLNLKSPEHLTKFIKKRAVHGSGT
jgi:intracellular sulfur oxidation DsrE/DsrF family protein